MSLQATITPVALDRDGISTSQTPAGAGNLTITGAFASGGAVTFTDAQFVGIYSGSNIAARVFTVTGTDIYGAAQTETITGVNAGTVFGVKLFKTVTQIAVDAGTGAAVEAGNSGLLKTKWYPLKRNGQPFNVSAAVKISGTCTFSLEHSMTPLTYAVADDSIDAWTTSATSGKSADLYTTFTSPVYGVRVNVTAFTSGTLKLYILEGN